MKYTVALNTYSNEWFNTSYNVCPVSISMPNITWFTYQVTELHTEQLTSAAWKKVFSGPKKCKKMRGGWMGIKECYINSWSQNKMEPCTYLGDFIKLIPAGIMVKFIGHVTILSSWLRLAWVFLWCCQALFLVAVKLIKEFSEMKRNYIFRTKSENKNNLLSINITEMQTSFRHYPLLHYFKFIWIF